MSSELPISFAETRGDGATTISPEASAGQILREAREKAGMHVAALAVSLKVPVKKLEALEADRLHELPDAVFVRALASSVCRALKTDPVPVLARLPQLNTRVLDQAESGVNVAFRTPADGPAPSALSQLSRPPVLVVLALLLGALVMMLLPDFVSRTASTSNQSSNAAPAVQMGSVAPVPNPGQAASEATSVVSVSATLQSPSLSLAPAQSTPTVASPTLVLTPAKPSGDSMMPGASTSTLADASSPLPPVPSDAVLVLAATGETWIEVRDANGKILLQRTLASGDRTGLSAANKLPLTVITGRMANTQVQVRGKNFDLAAVASKDGVARFQVK